MDRLECILNPNFIDSSFSGSPPPLELARYINTLTKHQVVEQVAYFHQSLPEYSLTPLINLDCLSKELAVKTIMVKDESYRFDLNAFKMLGASYAIAEVLAKKLALSPPYSFAQIKAQANRYQDITLATTTDGNHGRAVAWCAQKFGCQARVYLPKNSATIRLEAIKQFTPHAQITELNYDDTVAMVAKLANKNRWQLIQDTAWQNYTEIPDNIMRGYFSLIREFEYQSPDAWPTHVFLQAGVGSMAAAITAYFVAHHKPTPRIVLVEPNNADCFFQSIKINDGTPHQSGNLDTIMAGLACGIPSITAWQILSRYCFGFIRCDDQITQRGMQRYAFPIGVDQSIKSGESAAVTLGVLETLMQDKALLNVKHKLSLNTDSMVLLLSTEGDTDPINYQKLIAK